jgi:hypothetical protein
MSGLAAACSASWGTADFFIEGCLVLRKSAMLCCKSSPYLGIGDDLRRA